MLFPMLEIDAVGIIRKSPTVLRGKSGVLKVVEAEECGSGLLECTLDLRDGDDMFVLVEKEIAAIAEGVEVAGA